MRHAMVHAIGQMGLLAQEWLCVALKAHPDQAMHSPAMLGDPRLEAVPSDWLVRVHAKDSHTDLRKRLR